MGPEPTAFDFRLYQHPPERLVALADRRAWTNRARPTAAIPAAPQRQKEKPMANEQAGGGTTVPANPSAALAATVEAARGAPTATTVTRADASEIVTLCIAGGVPAMAASLLAEGATIDQAKERIGAAGEVTNLVALARRKDPTLAADLAVTMLTEGKTVEQARAALFDKLVATEEKSSVSSHVPAALGKAGATASATSMERELKRAGIKKDA
nr:hypothetical protein [Methylobacterium sp. BTF04]